jgi:hypothetical protein
MRSRIDFRDRCPRRAAPSPDAEAARRICRRVNAGYAARTLATKPPTSAESDSACYPRKTAMIGSNPAIVAVR